VLFSVRWVEDPLWADVDRIVHVCRLLKEVEANGRLVELDWAAPLLRRVVLGDDEAVLRRSILGHILSLLWERYWENVIKRLASYCKLCERTEVLQDSTGESRLDLEADLFRN